jgi:hypothetical protein
METNRCFDRAPLAFTSVLALALASSTVWLATPAFADDPNCSFSINPQITLALDGSPDLVTGLADPNAHWATNCTGACASDWQNTASVSVVYANSAQNPPEQACSADVDTGDQNTSGTFSLSTCCVGCQVTASITASCSDAAQSTGPQTVAGNTLVIAPWVVPLSQMTILPNTDPSNAALYQPFANLDYRGDPAFIPVGYPFAVKGISANPRGNEQVTLHAQGAGANFTRSYGYQVDADGKPIDVGTQWLADNDPAALIVTNSTGQVNFWVEFQGQTSPTRVLTVVSTNPTANSSTGSSGSTGSTSNGGHSGCGTTPGNSTKPEWLALAILSVLFVRWRRR